MITFYNHLHAQHQGRLEMFRGELVPCFEVPARADHMLAELQGCKLGTVQPPHVFDDSAQATGWDDWVALDPATAQRDALQEPGWRHVRARTARSAQRNNGCRVAVHHLP